MKGLPPRINEANRPWWEGLDREAIVMPRCDDCHRLIFYPRIHCPYCFSRNVSWAEVTEAPTLFTWAKAEHSVSPAYDHLGPIILAVADFAGAHVPTTIVDTAEQDIEVGMTLIPVFDRESYPGFTLLRFKGAQ
jgi:uncharacterized OB-fold protein